MRSSEEQIQGALETWMTATARGDISALADLMADDLIHTDPSGVVRTRKQLLDELRAVGQLPPLEVSADEVMVRFYGRVAVVTGRTMFKGLGLMRQFRFTDVFLNDLDNWKVVASHTTAIGETTA